MKSTRRSILAIVGGFVGSYFATKANVAQSKTMAAMQRDENDEPPILPKPGTSLQQLGAVQVLSVQYVRFTFSSQKGNWNEVGVEIPAPSGWDFASIAMASWKLQYDNNDDHELVSEGIVMWPSGGGPDKVIAKCRALLNDSNNDDSWSGYAQGVLTFYKSS